MAHRKSIFTAGSLPAQKRPFDKLGKWSRLRRRKNARRKHQNRQRAKKYDIFELNHKIFTLN